jgi:2-polyprenyl-3-methyl-5-hydroxy-6-metoxy-1,4-benzoquinol methylase
MMPVEICIVCRDGRKGFRDRWPGLKQCGNCGHCVADLDISHLNLKEVYKDSYFCGDEYADYLRDRSTFERHFRDRLRDMRRFQPGPELLEIGCAYGLFLGVAQQDYRVRGFDIAEGPVDYARQHLGVDARCEDFLEAPLEPSSVDVVAMWDTIEHLPRPDLTVGKIGQVLRPGGLLFLTTGDIDSFLARVKRDKWRLFHPPTHLHYFSRRTMVRLLESAGLQVVKTKYVGVRRSIHQVAYSLLALGKPRPSRLYHLVADSAIGDFSFVLNTYDIMLVVGQKG